jgi:hypothetical protein
MMKTKKQFVTLWSKKNIEFVVSFLIYHRFIITTFTPYHKSYDFVNLDLKFIQIKKK